MYDMLYYFDELQFWVLLVLFGLHILFIMGSVQLAALFLF